MTKRLKCEHPHYPDVLPVIAPEWLTDTVLALARGVHESGNYDTLPILADALQDAGCDLNDELSHLRHGIHECGNREKHEGGCWQGTCWIVRHLLKEPQRVLAAYRLPGMFEGDVAECPVLNPGDANGTAWLVETTTIYVPDRVRLIVEANYRTTAQDDFVDSAFGEDIRLTEPDLNDYKIEEPSDVFAAEWSCNWTSDGNHPYDADEIDVVDMSDETPGHPFVFYHGPGIRHGGVAPSAYAWGDWECMVCGRPIGYIPKDVPQACNDPKCLKELTEHEDSYKCVVCGKQYVNGYSDLVCTTTCRNSL